MIELDKTDPALGQAPRHQTVVGEARFAELRAVASANRIGFFANVHGVRRIHLHAEGHFVLGNPSQGFRIAEFRITLLVDLFHGVENSPSFGRADLRRGIKVEDGLAVRTALHALIDARKKTRAPELLSSVRSVAT